MSAAENPRARYEAERRGTLAMKLRLQALMLVLGCLPVWAGCSGKHIVAGEQCLSPYSDKAKEQSAEGGGAALYGTSCAPCKANDIKYDKRGCPKYVTFESCGGDICLAGSLLTQHGDEDAGELPADAGAADAQVNEEDGGAR